MQRTYITAARAKRTLVVYMARLANALGIRYANYTILCFHSISDTKDRYTIGRREFERQIDTLAKTFRFVSLDEVLCGRQVKRNRPAIAITFDDGYRDIQNILPITRRYQIPITLFALSCPAQANRKELGNGKKLLSVSQLRFLHKQGWEIGCHSQTHAPLSLLNDRELAKEIIASKRELERKLGAPVRYFSYPHAIYTDHIIRFVTQAGYDAAFSVNFSSIRKTTHRFIVPRIIIDTSYSVSDFPFMLHPASLLAQHLWTLVASIKCKPKQRRIGKPSFFRLLGANLRTNKAPSVLTPQQIGPYTLQTSLPSQFDPTYRNGIYVYRKKKYFVKTWIGTQKDIHYYHLLNEYYLSTMLQKTIEKISDFTHLHMSKAVAFYEIHGRVSVIFEYLEGVCASTLPLTRQASVIGTVLSGLTEVSKHLKKKEKQNIMHIGYAYYSLHLLYYALRNILIHPKVTSSAITQLIMLSKKIWSEETRTLQLAHRDLCPNNIYVSNKKIYLLDYGSLAFTFHDYDISALSVNPCFPIALSQDVIIKKGTRLNSFVKNFLLIMQKDVPTNELSQTALNVSYAR